MCSSSASVRKNQAHATAIAISSSEPVQFRSVMIKKPEIVHELKDFYGSLKGNKRNLYILNL